ncbi:MAG: chorismate-binding protein, partial [Bacteroidota bacterium]
MTSVPLAPPAPLLERSLRTASGGWDGQSILRVEVPAPVAEPLVWLGAQFGDLKTYWRGRGDTEARATLGAALTIEADRLGEVPGRLGETLAALPPNARLVTTARFDVDAEVGAEWRAFGAVRFVLPRVEYRVDGRRASITVHLVPGDDVRAVLARVARLSMPEASAPAALDLPYMRRDDPDRAEWGRMLRWSFGAFDAGVLDKVVLARRARFLFEEDVDPIALLRRLEAATPRCFHALVAPPPASALDGSAPAFLTATPERLLRLRGRSLETEAVAGTRPRDEADGVDDRLRDELLASEKDQREHAFVRDAIQDALLTLADHVSV